MSRTRCWIGLLAVAAFAAPAPAGDPPKDTLRDDLAALVSWVPDSDRDAPPDGPSPTALVARIVARGDAKVRAELKTLWRLATTGGTPASERRRAVLETIRFLWGTADAKDPPIRAVEGAIVTYVPPHGTYDFGSFDDDGSRGKPAPPSFDVLVKGGKLRTVVKPQAAKLLDAIQRPDVQGWATAAREALARATGEACAGAAAAKLVALASQQPTDPMLSTALAWSGAPEAEAELRSRVASLAPRVADGKSAAAPLLAAAVSGLAHVKREALHEELGKLGADARAAAVAAAGTRIALGWVLDRATKSPEASRAEAMDLVGRCLGDGNTDGEPADLARLVRWLADAAAEPADRDAALRTAETLLYAYNRYPITGSSSMNGIAESTTGARLGPYPGMDVVLAALADDLAQGVLAFGDERMSLWDEPPAEAADRWIGADAAVPSPLPNHPSPDSASPVRVTGEVGDGGLRITLTNRSAKPFSVLVPALRYGCADLVTVRVKSGAVETSFTNLKLELGFVRARLVAPASSLVVVAPGASASWTVPLLAAHRTVDHISVDVSGSVRIAGVPPAPVLSRFGEAWIR